MHCLAIAAVLSLSSVRVLAVHDEFRFIGLIDNGTAGRGDGGGVAPSNRSAAFGDSSSEPLFPRLVIAVGAAMLGTLLLLVVGAAMFFWWCGSWAAQKTEHESHEQNDTDNCFEIVEGSAFQGGAAVAGYSGRIAVPQDEGQLEQLLKTEGINTSEWGEALATLQDELARGECYLTFTQATGQPKKLVREVRLLLVRISASFPTGLQTLMKCEHINTKNQEEATANYKNLAKRIHGGDDVDEELPELLHERLLLSIECQEKHLPKAHTCTKISSSEGTSHGLTFPTLPSQYKTEEVWIKIEDVNAKEVVEKLHCGKQGAFQIVGADNKARWFEWTPATDFDRDTFERAA